MKKVAAIIGGGVIGAGWLARFLLNGWDVRVFDPDPEAERKVDEVLLNAKRALPMLYDFKLPEEGNLYFCSTIKETVEDAVWIQESVPERLDIKQAVLSEIQILQETMEKGVRTQTTTFSYAAKTPRTTETTLCNQ